MSNKGKSFSYQKDTSVNGSKHNVFIVFWSMLAILLNSCIKCNEVPAIRKLYTCESLLVLHLFCIDNEDIT